jgi:hypothetical protein
MSTINRTDSHTQRPETAADTQTYPLYGLTVSSQIPLPLQRIQAGSADLRISRNRIIPIEKNPSIKTLRRLWKKRGQNWRLTYQDSSGGTMHFDYNGNGTKIDISQTFRNWNQGLFVLLNPAMAAALFLRRKYILHASSLVLNNRSFLFSGPSGMGKSTISAALAFNGFRLHADDMAVMDTVNNDVPVQPGYPLLKLFNHTAREFGLKKAELRTIFPDNPDYPESWIHSDQFGSSFYNSPAPLKSIYILSGRDRDSTTFRTEKIRSGEAVINLLPYLYGDTWLKWNPEKKLAFFSDIASKTDVYKLWVPEGIEPLLQGARLFRNELMNQF